MNKPERHIFVCTSSRPNGQQKGFCHTKDGVSVLGKFIEELEERGLSGEVMVSNTGCFGYASKGRLWWSIRIMSGMAVSRRTTWKRSWKNISKAAES